MRPQRFGELLEKLLEKPVVKRGITRAKVMASFREVIKDTFGEVAKPVDFKRNILYVEVESSAWLNEISFFKEEIIKRVNLELGEEVCKGIKFQVKEA